MRQILNLEFTSIQNLLLLPKGYNLANHTDSIQVILERHQVFKKFYTLEQKIQPTLASMEESGLVIAKEWFRSGLEGKKIKLQETIAEISKYFDEPIDSIERSAVDNFWQQNQLFPANNYDELSKYQNLHPIYNMLLKYKRYQSYLNQWGAKLKNEGKELGEGILITGHWQSFSSHTGRITAKRLPLTSMPVSMRDFVVAPEGFNIMSLDMANAELRFLAHHAQCKSLIEKFNNGEDIHQETAGLIKKEISSGYVVDDETARELAKRYTYSLLYGASVRTVTDNLQKILPQVMTLNVVNINEAFKQRYPELDDFLVARERSTKLLTPFGEVEPIASFNRMQKRNFTLQSSVSVAIKLLMKIISDPNATVVHVLHDEVWILVPNGYSTETLIETITKDFKEEIQKVFPGFPNVNLLACEKIGGRNNGK